MSRVYFQELRRSNREQIFRSGSSACIAECLSDRLCYVNDGNNLFDDFLVDEQKFFPL